MTRLFAPPCIKEQRLIPVARRSRWLGQLASLGTPSLPEVWGMVGGQRPRPQGCLLPPSTRAPSVSELPACLPAPPVRWELCWLQDLKVCVVVCARAFPGVSSLWLCGSMVCLSFPHSLVRDIGSLRSEGLAIDSHICHRLPGKEWWACVDLTGGCQLAFQGRFRVPQHAPRWVCSDCLIF